MKQNIIISTHVYATGPSQELLKFLLEKKIFNLLFLGHPLLYRTGLTGSGYDLYKSGKLVKSSHEKLHKLPEIFDFIKYIRELVLNILYVNTATPMLLDHPRQESAKWDVYIGCNNLNALAGLILKKLKKVEKVIYYTIDYNPQRFDNKLLNFIYHKIDHFCVKHCDETWNLTSRMAWGREQFFGVKSKRQIVVENGVWLDRIQTFKPKKINYHTLVFMGHAVEKQGIQHVLYAIPHIVEKISDFKFLIIGTGDYLPILQELALKLDIKKYVEFIGYVESHESLEHTIKSCGVAVALYENKKEGNQNFTYFADPYKLKVYLACGVPVILTDVPHNAREIASKNCGIIVDNSTEQITNAILYLMTDIKKLKEYKTNCSQYIQKYNWTSIFNNVCSRL